MLLLVVAIHSTSIVFNSLEAEFVQTLNIVQILRELQRVNRRNVRGSAHHGTIHKEKSNKMQQCVNFFIIPYLYEAQHVSGETPPIIRSLKLH